MSDFDDGTEVDTINVTCLKDYDNLGILTPLLNQKEVYAAMHGDDGVVGIFRNPKSSIYDYYTMLYRVKNIQFYQGNDKKYPNYYVPNESKTPQPLIAAVETERDAAFSIIPTLYSLKTARGYPALKRWENAQNNTNHNGTHHQNQNHNVKHQNDKEEKDNDEDDDTAMTEDKSTKDSAKKPDVPTNESESQPVVINYDELWKGCPY